jgi:hypothetical protein
MVPGTAPGTLRPPCRSGVTGGQWQIPGASARLAVLGGVPGDRALARFLARARIDGVAVTVAPLLGRRADHVHNVVKVAMPLSYLIESVAQLRASRLPLCGQVVDGHAAPALCR